MSKRPFIKWGLVIIFVFAIAIIGDDETRHMLRDKLKHLKSNTTSQI